MNLALDHEPDTNRILVYSALGSILLHGLILALLALAPQSSVIDQTPPRIQVQLVSGVQEQPVPQPQPIQPTVTSAVPPPMPMPKPVISQPPPPVPAIVQPLKLVETQPRPVPGKRPVLKDSRSIQALQAREMMKMASPSRPSVPRPPQQTVMPQPIPMTPPPSPPLPRIREKMPAMSPPVAKAPQALQANPPESLGAGTTKPALLASSKPLYPRVAREAGWEGTVIVRTLIDTEGNPERTEVRKSSGHPPLDQSAIEAIKTWKFRPAKDGNIPIVKWVDIPVKFDLDDR